MKNKSTKKSLLNQMGFTQWVILIVLMFGIGVGVWVAQVRTNLSPQANVNEKPAGVTAVVLKVSQPIIVNKSFDLQIQVKSDLDPVRLVTAHLKYNPTELEIVKVQTPSATSSAVIYATASAETTHTPMVTQWLESLFDNKQGTAAITGLYQSGDLKTALDKDPLPFATVTMKAKTLNPSEIIVENTSMMLRVADNANILTRFDTVKITPVTATESGEVKK